MVGAFVQGIGLMPETMAQYSALMVMKKKFGKEKMRKFLKYELERYLAGGSSEREGEMPLLYNEVNLIRDYIGEEKLNGALNSAVRQQCSKAP